MKIKAVAVSVLLAILAISCAEVTATATIKVLLHTKTGKTMTLGDTALDITRFTVSGTGPGGKTFAVDSTSSSVSIPGMPVGFWEIEAVGYNSKRKEIARGQASFNLSSSENSVSIILENETGKGSLQIKYDWDEDISDPIIKLNIISYNKRNNSSKTIKPATDTDSCTYTVSDLPSGYYITESVLYNGNQEIIGSAEAVRIANSEKTTGTISFRQNTAYSQDLTQLTLYRASGSPLSGHFEDTPSSVNSGEQTEFSLILDSSYSENENCTIQWYLDGHPVTESLPLSSMDNRISIVPQTGSHIVNAFVTDPTWESIGSISWKFTSKISGNKGSAAYLSIVKKDTNSELPISSDTVIGALPNDHFCIITPSQNSICLCSVYNNTLSVNSKNTVTTEGFSWISQSDNVFSSEYMTDFAVTDSSQNISFLYYNKATSQIKNAYRGGEIARFEKQYSVSVFSVPMTNIETVCFAENTDESGTVILSSSDSSLLLSFMSDGTDITAASMVPKPDGVNKISAMDICKNSIVAVSKETPMIYSSSWNGTDINGLWNSCETEYQHPCIVKLLNSENLLVSDGNNLSRYSFSKANGWRFQQSFDTSVKFLEVSDDGKYFWVVTDNSLETYTTQNQFIHVIGKLKLNMNITAVAKSKNYFLLKTDQESIIVCQISKGD